MKNEKMSSIDIEIEKIQDEIWEGLRHIDQEEWMEATAHLEIANERMEILRTRINNWEI